MHRDRPPTGDAIQVWVPYRERVWLVVEQHTRDWVVPVPNRVQHNPKRAVHDVRYRFVARLVAMPRRPVVRVPGPQDLRANPKSPVVDVGLGGEPSALDCVAQISGTNRSSLGHAKDLHVGPVKPSQSLTVSGSGRRAGHGFEDLK